MIDGFALKTRHDRGRFSGPRTVTDRSEGIEGAAPIASDRCVDHGTQIEQHFPGIRGTDQNRRAYAAQLTLAIRSFELEHFGFFEPTP